MIAIAQMIGAALSGALLILLAMLAARAFRTVKQQVLDAGAEIRTLNERLATMTKANGGLMDTIDGLEKQVAALGGYVQGFVKVCEDMVVQHSKVVGAVTGLQEVLVPKDPGDVTDHYDEGVADLMYRKQSFMAEGYTEDEALARAKSDEKGNLLYNPNPGF